MGRAIGSVVLGYVVMFLVVFVTFSVAYAVMGEEGAFQAGGYQVSGLWIVVSSVLSIVAAIAGGYVCAVVARAVTPPRVLAGIVLVLGLLMAIPVLSSDSEPTVRTEEVATFEAMGQAEQPAWAALLNPVIGAVGVLVGAGLAANRRRDTAG